MAINNIVSKEKPSLKEWYNKLRFRLHLVRPESEKISSTVTANAKVVEKYDPTKANSAAEFNRSQVYADPILDYRVKFEVVDGAKKSSTVYGYGSQVFDNFRVGEKASITYKVTHDSKKTFVPPNFKDKVTTYGPTHIQLLEANRM